MEDSALFLVSVGGMLCPMTQEEYKDFIESRDCWDSRNPWEN